jgi:hypothetical protein
VATKGRAFGADAKDYDNLRVVGDDLYWHDKKVKTGGWTRAEKLTLTGILVSATVALVIALLVYFDKIQLTLETFENRLCASGQQQFCKPVEPVKKPVPASASASH